MIPTDADLHALLEMAENAPSVAAANPSTVAALVRELLAHREEINRLTALVYIGDHHFPDLTWKVRAEELNAEARDLQRKLLAHREAIARATAIANEAADSSDTCVAAHSLARRIESALQPAPAEPKDEKTCAFCGTRWSGPGQLPTVCPSCGQ